MHGRGAIYDLFGTPSARIALATNGDLRVLRGLFAFSAALPLTGGTRVQTLVESKLSAPLIHSWIGAGRIAYGKYPIDGLNGYVDYYDSAVTLDALRGRYGVADVLLGGRALFGGDAGNDFVFALNARGPGASIPYADVLAPDSGVIATALIQAPPHESFRARGTSSRPTARPPAAARSPSTRRASASSARSSSAAPTARRSRAASSCSARSRRARAGCTRAASASRR